jgi:hypothetical protein
MWRLKRAGIELHSFKALRRRQSIAVDVPDALLYSEIRPKEGMVGGPVYIYLSSIYFLLFLEYKEYSSFSAKVK